METANVFDLKLVTRGEKIPSDILKNFPFWITSDEMDTHHDYWPEAEPPEGGELVGDERWVQFPENFSRQMLLFGEDEGFHIWTPDWIELSQKHNGVLFVVKGLNEIDPDDDDFPAYPSVHIHLRFKSELNRMAAIKDIRRLIREQNKEIKEQIESSPHYAMLAKNFPNSVAIRDIRRDIREQQENVILFFGQYPESVF